MEDSQGTGAEWHNYAPSHGPLLAGPLPVWREHQYHKTADPVPQGSDSTSSHCYILSLSSRLQQDKTEPKYSTPLSIAPRMVPPTIMHEILQLLELGMSYYSAGSSLNATNLQPVGDRLGTSFQAWNLAGFSYRKRGGWD